MAEILTLEDFQNRTPLREQEKESSKIVSLGDFMSMDPIQTPEVFTKFSPKEEAEIKARGKIGAYESATKKDSIGLIPFIGGIKKGTETLSLLNAVNRLQNDDYENLPDYKAKDTAKVSQFLRDREEERLRGRTIPGMITAGVMELPAFMLEFIATGGMATLGRKGAQKAALKTMNALTKKGVVNFSKKTARRVVAGTTGRVASATVRTALMPHRIVENFAERQVNSKLELTEKGWNILAQGGEKPYISLLKGFGDVWVENFSEEIGSALTAGGKKIIGKLPSRFTKAVTSIFKKLNPNKDVRILATKLGWNGFIEEMGEERVGAFMRAVFNIEDFGAENPDKILDRVIASIPNGEELLVEAGVLAFPGATNFAAQQTGKMIKDKKAQQIVKGEIKKAPVLDKPLTEKELTEVIEFKREEVKPIKEITPKAPEAKPLLKPTPKEEVSVPLIEEAKKYKSAEEFVESQIKTKEKLENAQEELRYAKEDKDTERISYWENKINDLESDLPEFSVNVEVANSKFTINAKTTNINRLKQIAKEKYYEIPETKTIAKKLVTDEDIKIGTLPKTKSQLTDIWKQAHKPEPIKAKPEVKKVKPLTTKLTEIRDKYKTEPTITKHEIKAVQSEVINILETSDLIAKDKAKFIKTIKNVQTVQQLNKAIPEINDRINKLERAETSRNIKTKIRKVLKTTKVKVQAGKPVGKFTPEIQIALDILRNSLNLTQGQAEAKLALNLESLGDKIPGFEMQTENSLLELLSGQKTLSNEDTKQLLNDIAALVQGGKDLKYIKGIAIAEKAREERELALKDIIGDKTPYQTRNLTTMQKLSIKFAGAFKTMMGWDNILNLLAIDKKVAPGQSSLEKMLEVRTIETKEKKGIRVETSKIIDFTMDSFGLTTEKQMVEQFNKDSKIIDHGSFTNARGEYIPHFELSKAEARKVWMELQDPTLIETLTIENGNAYTPEMIQAIENFLTEEDRNFALKQLAFYREYYQSINNIYRDIYGVDLPFNEFYSPIKRKFQAVDVTSEFLQDIQFRRSVAPGGVKSRIESITPIEVQSDIGVLQRHITEMEHFKAWAFKIKQLNNVFANNKIKDTIKEKYTREMNKIINIHLQNFTRGGIDRSRNLSAIDMLRVNFTRAALALKPALYTKQLVSFIAYADEVSVKDFTVGVIDFISNHKEAVRILSESELLKARGLNLTRDMQDAIRTEEWEVFKKNPSFINSLMFMTKLGDRGAIILGGWSVYKSTLKKTGSKEKAMAEFERITAATQQSADLSQLSTWQTGNSFQKLFTMFTSSQNQYFRKEYMAIRNLLAGKQSIKKTAKTIFIYHFILPMFFQWISDFGKWDEEEQKRAAILGSFNGIFIIKDVLDTVIRKALGMKTFRTESIPALTFVDGVYKAMSDLSHDDITTDDIISAIKNLSETVGYGFGIPMKLLNDWLEGLEDITEGREGRGTLKLLGWSPYVIDKNLGNATRRRR